jgi:hypothetical protein
MYVCQSPQKGALLHTYGQKHKVTVHVAPRRQKANIQLGAAWFPKDWAFLFLQHKESSCGPN